VSFYRGTNAGWTGEWRDIDLEVQDLVTALRSRDFQVPPYQLPVWDGRTRTISDRAFEKVTALGYVSRRLVALMKAAGYEDAAVVPVPSTSHIQAGAPFLSQDIARAIEKREPRFVCSPALHFAKPLPRRYFGGRRTATAVRVNLRSTDLSGLRRVVLIDDIMTTGAHLKGAASYLSDRGIMVQDAFVVARLATRPPEDMFKVPPVELPV
jgi:hypothetical protein